MVLVWVLTFSFFLSIARPRSNIALAQTAFEEAYITILDVDGPVWAEKLLQAMQAEVVSHHDEGNNINGMATESTPLV